MLKSADNLFRELCEKQGGHFQEEGADIDSQGETMEVHRDTFDAKEVETMVEQDSGKGKLIETIPETKENVHALAQHEEKLPSTTLLLDDIDDKSNARSNIL